MDDFEYQNAISIEYEVASIYKRLTRSVESWNSKTFSSPIYRVLSHPYYFSRPALNCWWYKMEMVRGKEEKEWELSKLRHQHGRYSYNWPTFSILRPVRVRAYMYAKNEECFATFSSWFIHLKAINRQALA